MAVRVEAREATGVAKEGAREATREEARGEARGVAREEAKEPGGPQRRMGAIGIKLGMLSYYDEWGRRVPGTALFLHDCTVLRSFPLGVHTVIQEAGIGERSALGMHPWERNTYRALRVPPKRHVLGFYVSPEALLRPGTRIGAAHFVAGQRVDLQATSIGKGFQGAMKRWGFHGMPASHGCSLSHRALGATGGRTNASRVFPGKKMAGRMGGRRASMNSVLVLRVDPPNNTIIVAGSVPGHKGAHVRIQDSPNQVLPLTAAPGCALCTDAPTAPGDSLRVKL